MKIANLIIGIQMIAMFSLLFILKMNLIQFGIMVLIVSLAVATILTFGLKNPNEEIMFTGG